MNNDGTNNVVDDNTTNNTGAVTQPAGAQNKTEVTVTQPANKTEGEEKTFTQEEVNSFLKKETAKALKGMPSKEELKAFKEWQETQKTAEQKQAEKEAEYQKALSEKENVLQENKVLKAGVNADDVDYVVYKVSKMEGDFEENLAEFLEKNPKFINQGQEPEGETKGTSTGVHTQKQPTNQDSGVMAILKQKHPEIYK